MSVLACVCVWLRVSVTHEWVCVVQAALNRRYTGPDGDARGETGRKEISLCQSRGVCLSFRAQTNWRPPPNSSHCSDTANCHTQSESGLSGQLDIKTLKTERKKTQSLSESGDFSVIF